MSPTIRRWIRRGFGLIGAGALAVAVLMGIGMSFDGGHAAPATHVASVTHVAKDAHVLAMSYDGGKG